MSRNPATKEWRIVFARTTSTQEKQIRSKQNKDNLFSFFLAFHHRDFYSIIVPEALKQRGRRVTRTPARAIAARALCPQRKKTRSPPRGRRLESKRCTHAMHSRAPPGPLWRGPNVMQEELTPKQAKMKPRQGMQIDTKMPTYPSLTDLSKGFFGLERLSHQTPL